jgi:hypothetical protein
MRKIIGIFIMTLFFAIAIFPAIGTIIESIDNYGFLKYNDNVEWARTYGGDEADKFWDVEETSDGGYIAVGTTEIENKHYPWVLKVDSDGNEMWNWLITEFIVDGEVLEINYCWQSNVLPISDGGYIISLTALDTNYNDEVYQFGAIAKLSSDGNEEWMIIQGDGFEWSIRNEYFMEVEDGILGVGDYVSPPKDIYEMDTSGCFFKINYIGELEWYKVYDYGDFVDKLNGILFTNDGGFLLAGCVGIVAERYYDGWLVKTDAQGEKEWEKTFKGNRNDVFWGCTKIDNGDYIMVGWTESFGFGNMDVWVMKTDSNGDEIWNKTFGDGRYEIGYDYDTTDDDGVVIPMLINNMFAKDSYVIKIDNDGNAEWKHVYSIETKSYFIGISSTSEGGCIVAGILGPWDSGNSDALLVKYAPMENQRPNKPVTPTGPSKGDPDIEYTFSTSTTDPDGDTIMYKWDWGDGNFSSWLETSEASYTWSYKDNFEIRVMARDSNGGESDWSDSLSFSTPRSKNILILERLLERFQILESLI